MLKSASLLLSRHPEDFEIRTASSTRLHEDGEISLIALPLTSPQSPLSHSCQASGQGGKEEEEEPAEPARKTKARRKSGGWKSPAGSQKTKLNHIALALSLCDSLTQIAFVDNFNLKARNKWKVRLVASLGQHVPSLGLAGVDHNSRLLPQRVRRSPQDV